MDGVMNWWEDLSGLSHCDARLYSLVVQACMERGVKFSMHADKRENERAREAFQHLYREAKSACGVSESAIKDTIWDKRFPSWYAVERQRLGPDWLRDAVWKLADYMANLWPSCDVERPEQHEYVPPNIVESLRRYAEHGVPTGSFLRAVLENDLISAVVRADDVNAKFLANIVRYAYSMLPHGCWGSRELVDVHIKRKERQRS